MSAFGGGGPAFQIFSDSSNSENQNAAARKSKSRDPTGKQPANKRAALGEISNNTRAQPSRAVKQGKAQNAGLGGFGLENAGGKGQKFQFNSQSFSSIGQTGSFKIHVDTTTAGPSIVTVSRATVASQIASSVASINVPVVTLAPSRPEGLQLRPAVTNLHTSFHEESIVIDDDVSSSPSSSADSPMLLDMSISEQVKKNNLQKIVEVPEYTEEIYTHLLSKELKHYPAPYMKKQQDINPNMRNILVDWLTEVGEEYKLHRETVFLGVNYIDRFLCKMSVNRKKLQLVGAASMFVAAKYEEIYPPEVSEFVYITDNTYTKEEVLKMEHLILKVLNFDVATPTVNVFCEKFLLAAGYTEEDIAFNLTMMLAELTMLDSDTYLQFRPSVIAASSVMLAKHTLGLYPAWPAHMETCSRYAAHQLTECVVALWSTYLKAPSHPQQAVMDKYKQTKMKEVALIPAPQRPPIIRVGSIQS